MASGREVYQRRLVGRSDFGDRWTTSLVQMEGESSTLDWTWHNWDLNATVHMLDGFWEETLCQEV